MVLESLHPIWKSLIRAPSKSITIRCIEIINMLVIYSHISCLYRLHIVSWGRWALKVIAFICIHCLNNWCTMNHICRLKKWIGYFCTLSLIDILHDAQCLMNDNWLTTLFDYELYVVHFRCIQYVIHWNHGRYWISNSLPVNTFTDILAYLHWPPHNKWMRITQYTRRWVPQSYSINLMSISDPLTPVTVGYRQVVDEMDFDQVNAPPGVFIIFSMWATVVVLVWVPVAIHAAWGYVVPVGRTLTGWLSKGHIYCNFDMYRMYRTLKSLWFIIGMVSKHSEPGGRLNKKDGLTRYGDSHVKDKTS